MKPEYKEFLLLLQDLCGRLPYGVKCQFEDNMRVTDGESSPFYDYVLSAHHLEIFMRHNNYNNFHIKPYLRPMSSMTEEEKKELINHVLEGEGAEYFHITHDGSIDGNQAAEQDLYNLNLHWLNFGPITTSSYIDWLNKNMFDYRGLIDKGLAIEVTEDNNPYKN